MSGIEDIRFYYDEFDWRCSGEFWASRWDNTAMQWYGTILPRIHGFLPAQRVVEIGPGKGRLSQYLEPLARDELILVDIAEACIAGCKERFKGNAKVRCHLTGGLNMGQIAPRSVDFVFSIYSLVHADAATMRGYVADIAEKLSDGGSAFLHHSNAASLVTGDKDRDSRMDEYRDTSVSAKLVAETAAEVGLICKSQELFGWDDGKVLSDCFTVLSRAGAEPPAQNVLIHNWEFPEEAKRLGMLARAYSPQYLGGTS